MSRNRGSYDMDDYEDGYNDNYYGESLDFYDGDNVQKPNKPKPKQDDINSKTHQDTGKINALKFKLPPLAKLPSFIPKTKSININIKKETLPSLETKLIKTKNITHEKTQKFNTSRFLSQDISHDIDNNFYFPPKLPISMQKNNCSTFYNLINNSIDCVTSISNITKIPEKIKISNFIQPLIQTYSYSDPKSNLHTTNKKVKNISQQISSIPKKGTVPPSPDISTVKNNVKTESIDETVIVKPISALSISSNKPASSNQKQKLNNVNNAQIIESLLNQRRETGDECINVITIGHVDAGKSTLVGHLLYLTGMISQKAMHKNETESKKAGKGSFAYAWILDENTEERNRGITMDITHRTIKLKDRRIDLIDSPGHKDFVPNMISGASQADAAILVIDATKGEFETGFLAGGQTREHTLLARSFGVNQLIIAINKMDTVSWSFDRFKSIQKEIMNFLLHIGFKDKNCRFVPVSGLLGINLSGLTALDKENLQKNSWISQYGTLLNALEELQLPKKPTSYPLRFIITDYYKSPIGAGVCLTGKIETGYIGDPRSLAKEKFIILPVNEIVTIKAIKHDYHDHPDSSALVAYNSNVTTAIAGDQVTLVVNTSPDFLPKLSSVGGTVSGLGQVLCPLEWPIHCASVIEAKILIFDLDVSSSPSLSNNSPISGGFGGNIYSKVQNTSYNTDYNTLNAFTNSSSFQPITLGFQAVFHYMAFSEPCFISKLIGLIDKSTGALLIHDSEVYKLKKPRVFSRGDSGLCQITFNRPIAIEAFTTSPNNAQQTNINDKSKTNTDNVMVGIKELSRFTLRYSGHSVAAGYVTKIIK